MIPCAGSVCGLAALLIIMLAFTLAESMHWVAETGYIMPNKPVLSCLPM